jgi:hypothetical protein
MGDDAQNPPPGLSRKETWKVHSSSLSIIFLILYCAVSTAFSKKYNGIWCVLMTQGLGNPCAIGLECISLASVGNMRVRHARHDPAPIRNDH